jgi:hypothetical protein
MCDNIRNGMLTVTEEKQARLNNNGKGLGGEA